MGFVSLIFGPRKESWQFLVLIFSSTLLRELLNSLGFGGDISSVKLWAVGMMPSFDYCVSGGGVFEPLRPLVRWFLPHFFFNFFWAASYGYWISYFSNFLSFVRMETRVEVYALKERVHICCKECIFWTFWT